MSRPGIEPRSPGPLVNTLTIMPMSGKTIQLMLNNCFINTPINSICNVQLNINNYFSKTIPASRLLLLLAQ